MSSAESLLPYYKLDKKPPGFFIVVPFSNFGWVILSLPFFSFVFCVIWSIMFNFEEANATHCSVENYLPSISAAIGSFYPQKYVWMFAISLHFPPRLVITRMYSKYFDTVIDSRCSLMQRLTTLLNFFENCFLLGLTLISSTTQYTIHAFCFVSFLITSMIYMGSSCFLLKFRRKIPPNNLESKTLKWKFYCYVVNLLCFILSGYFFYRHNEYCEPGVYSIFALFEYGVVLSNMCFHITAVWDFYDKYISIASDGINFS